MLDKFHYFRIEVILRGSMITKDMYMRKKEIPCTNRNMTEKDFYYLYKVIGL